MMTLFSAAMGDPPDAVRIRTRHDTGVSTQQPAQVLGPVVTGIDHVGFAVNDLDAAIEFYERAFGLPLVHQEINEEQGVHEAMIGLGNACIQLLAPLTPDSTIGKYLEKNGQGIQQVAFRVTDIDLACDRLREAGLRLIYDSPRRGTAGSRVNFVHPKDCGGVLVELVEPAPEH
jgi:methylmalonyl-CoA/ethylmalonyl-CoA epimerase